MLREEKERKRAANGSDPGERENHQAIGYGLLVDTKRRHYTDILQFKIGALFTTFKKEKRKEKENFFLLYKKLIFIFYNLKHVSSN